MAELKLYTWHYFDGYNPHSLTVVASTSSEAVDRLMESVIKKRILNLAGPYTKTLEKIVVAGIRRTYDQPAISLEEFIRQTEPRVTDLDVVISVSALDG